MLEYMGNDFLPSCSPVVLDEAVNSRKVFYRLGESEFFTYANKNSTIGGSKLIDVIPRMTVEDNGFLHVALKQLDKSVLYELFESPRFKISCKKAMQELIESGKVVMVYSETYRIPTSIPYIIQNRGNDCIVYVNVSDFVSLNQYGIFEVSQVRDYNALMAILFAACAAYRIIVSTTTLPSDLADGMVLMYAGMIEKIIHSIVHMDPVMKDKIRYLATEFALIQMYGTETGTKLFYRYKNTYFPKLSKMITESIDNQFKLDNFDKLSLFIDELKRIYPSMKGLTLNVIYDKWIRAFGPATAMSIDYLGYHLYTICMVLFESPLVTRMALEPILEKSGGAAMYKRLQTLIGS